MTFKVPQWLDKVIVWPVLLWRWFWHDHTYRRVKLLPDKYAKVEPRDYHEISKYTWWACKTSHSFMAVRFEAEKRKLIPVYMHREIMLKKLKPQSGKLPPELFVDHKNRDATDNRRTNLRLATRAQNNMNRRNFGKTSNYKGVTLNPPKIRYRAIIHANGKNIHLGYFGSEIEAARAYDKAARKYHGEFAYQNFENENRQLTRRAKIRKFIRKLTQILIYAKGAKRKVARGSSYCRIGQMMADNHKLSRVWVYFIATRPAFLTASAAPVLVGSALGFAVTGSFSVGLFVLALFATMLLHSGANVANDYFDHLSGNDWAGEKPTPFSGGSRLIQKGILSPKATLIESLVLLAAGALLGIIIVLLSGSLLILLLGIVGLLGGFFYTAKPVKLCYRTLGEAVIALLFGILPVTGAYYLQAGRLDFVVGPAAAIAALLIFLIILINEFADVHQDSSANKKTLVVRFGVPRSVIIYRTALALTYLIAVLSLIISGPMRYGAIGYLLTLLLGVNVFTLANTKNLTEARDFRVNARTILLHAAGALAITVGLVVYGLTSGGL